METLTAHAFFEFADTRPDEERWELLDGVLEINAAPSVWHQTILGNIYYRLRRLDGGPHRAWVPVLGIGLRITDNNVAIPDLLVRPDTYLAGRECDDALVAFEILSPSTALKDRRIKRSLYASLPSLQQYVIVAQDSLNVLSYERRDGAQERGIASADAPLALPSLGVELALADIYEGNGL